MTETPSKWASSRAREEALWLVWDGISEGEWGDKAVEIITKAFAQHLDAARAEGEAKGRREALEEAARLCDASEARIMTKLRKLEKPSADLAGAAAVGGADTAEKLARRIRNLIDKETDRFSQPGKMAEGETDR